MARSGLVGPVILTLSLLAGAAGCGSAAPTNQTAASPVSPSVSAQTAEASSTDGRAVLAEAQAAGKPYVLWYWGTFCPDCQVDAAAVVSATRQFGTDVPIIGIPSPQDSEADRDAFIAELEEPVPQILDAPIEMWIDYKVVSTPTVVYVDAQGNTKTEFGPIFTKAFTKRLEELQNDPNALA